MLDAAGAEDSRRGRAQVDALKRAARLDRAELDERDELIGTLSRKLKAAKERLKRAGGGAGGTPDEASGLVCSWWHTPSLASAGPCVQVGRLRRRLRRAEHELEHERARHKASTNESGSAGGADLKHVRFERAGESPARASASADEATSGDDGGGGADQPGGVAAERKAKTRPTQSRLSRDDASRVIQACCPGVSSAPAAVQCTHGTHQARVPSEGHGPGGGRDGCVRSGFITVRLPLCRSSAH
jgi:hypothetical protein